MTQYYQTKRINVPKFKYQFNGRTMASGDAAVAELRKQQENVKKQLDESSAMYARISVWLDRWVQINFKTEGGNVGRWLPFRAGGRREAGGGLDASAKLLQDSGRLRASFLPFHSRRNAGIGSDLDYSEVHNEGLGGLPQRRMLPKRVEVIDDVRKIIVQFVRKAIK